MVRNSMLALSGSICAVGVAIILVVLARLSSFEATGWETACGVDSPDGVCQEAAREHTLRTLGLIAGFLVFTVGTLVLAGTGGPETNAPQ